MDESTLDWVVAGYIVTNNKLLLVHHRKSDKWLPVGGHPKPNETPDEALRREVREEVGLEIDFLQYPPSRRGNNREFALPFYVNHHPVKQNHSHYCLFYLCKPRSTDLVIARDELKGARWVSREELTSLTPALNQGDIITCVEALNLASG